MTPQRSDLPPKAVAAAAAFITTWLNGSPDFPTVDPGAVQQIPGWTLILALAAWVLDLTGIRPGSSPVMLGPFEADPAHRETLQAAMQVITKPSRITRMTEDQLVTAGAGLIELAATAARDRWGDQAPQEMAAITRRAAAAAVSGMN